MEQEPSEEKDTSMKELTQELGIENVSELSTSNSRTEKIKIWFLNWIKDPYNKVFLGIFILAIIIRLYYFWMTKDQAAWWDAADYLTQAKVLGKGLDVGYIFNPRRPFLLALLWGFLLKLGFGDLSIRFTEVIFSLLTVPAMYLIGKSIFNKKVGLISSFLITIFYLQLFFSFRFMTEVPTLMFFVFAMYFFWEGYIKKKDKMLIWFGVFLGLSLLARGGTSVMLFIFPIFLILTDCKFKFLKNKYLWLSVIIALTIFSTFFVFIYFKENVNPIVRFLGLTAEGSGAGKARFSGVMGFPGIFQYTSYMFTYFGTFLLIPFLLGVITVLGNILLNFDLIIKNKSEELKKDLFILIWALVPFLFHAILVDHMEPRYIIMAFPPFFLILSKGLLIISDIAKKYHKHLGILLIILVLGFGMNYQIKLADNLIKSKVPSYLEIRQSGEWIKENSNPSDIIFSASPPQHTYYAERQIYNYVHPGVNQTEFEQKVEELKPAFLVLSIYEPHAEWVLPYPDQHPELLTPVQAYQQDGQPLAIIYKFEYAREVNLALDNLSNNL